MKIPESCCRCGVCCFSTLANYVRVTGDDWTRLGDDAERVAEFAGNRAFMRMCEGHCAALELRHAEGGAAEFFCSIYEWRPQICRDLERGSPECEGELVAKRERSVIGGLAPGVNAGASGEVISSS